MFGAEGVKLQFNIHVHDGRVRPKEEGSVCVCVCVCVRGGECEILLFLVMSSAGCLSSKDV